MEHATLLRQVRSHVSALAADRFGEAEPEQAVCETILIRDGFYCGRCFAFQSFRAVWFIEEQVIKFFNAGGEFLGSEVVQSPAAEATFTPIAAAA